MIRKCTDEDISDEELEKVINPFYDNYHEYIITYVMPEVIAFYIASSYSRNAMWEATFYQHYNSAKDTFNICDDEDYDKVKVEDNNMTFKDLYDEFRMHNDEIMKDTTKYGYDNKEKFIECFFPVKVKDFNIMQFEQWKREINKLNISLRYKNDIYKFLKSILNFGVKWHNLNFQAVYNKMTKFQDPNECRKEMAYYTYDEFKKFISYEEDLRWKCVFEILYYCGLRKGELKGLTWKDINFDKKVLSVNKQITQRNNRVKFEFSDTKTRDSRRIVPITKVLLNDLKMMKNEAEKIPGFNDNFFVAGDMLPVCSNTLTNHKNVNCKLANVKQIRLHDFRHSCASLLVNKGANVQVVAKYLGHTKVEETLKTYSHLFTSTLDEVVAVIDNLDNNKTDDN